MRRIVGCLLILTAALFLPSIGRRFSLEANSNNKLVNASRQQTQSKAPQPGTVSDGTESIQTTAATDQEIIVNPDLAKTGRIQVLIEMQDEPAARVYARVKAASGKLPKVQAEAAAISAAKQQVVSIKAKQDTLATTLKSSRFQAEEVYRVQKAYNGISVYVNAAHLAAIRGLAGVKAVHVVVPEYPSTSTSVPFIGAPQVWANTVGLPAGADGAGIKIGIIDTGIDYQHPDFGGTGALSDYQANNRTVAPDAYFPTAKVVGGFDFCGDAYTGGNTPVPDADPMDCLGHGTHVAGIAAGVGVNADGTPYTGPYTPSANFAAMRIGPGAAPKASLYALRVFGCGGSTGLTVQAIDWAMDPNGDNDMSDHLDVINMSLGSAYGMPSSTSAVASDNAALVGVIVVASAGNDGDTYSITGSPGISARTLGVAASVDSGIPGSVLVINSPAGIAGNYAVSAANSFAPTPAPAPSGQTANIVVALDPADGAGPLTTDGCSALTNAAAVAGNIALIDRGTCGFQVKAANAQAAGAIAVIIANNVVGDPNLLSLGATGTTPVTIPCVFISKADADTIKAALASGSVNATLAAATAADTLASFSSRGPRLGSPFILKPDIAAPGLNITSAQTGVTCTGSGTGNTGCLVSDPTGFKASGQALTISGTSMAAPHMAGVMALLRQLHPTWTVEELKAVAMNGATHNITIGANGGGLRYGPGRVGAGRVDVVNSALSPVVAFNAEDEGVVSLTFDTEVAGVASLTKKLKIVNQATTPATYDLGIDTAVDAPGVAFSLPSGSSVTVMPGQAVEIPVQLDATASQMKHTREATVAPGQAAPSPLTSLGTLARHWMTEEAGYVTLSVGGQLKLRVPIYTALRPTSNMSAADTIVTGGAPTGSTTIPLSGSDVCTGTLGAGPTCTGTFPTDEVSLVTPFELQVASPRNTSIPGFADIQYVGVAYNASSNLLMFGVSTWEDWTSPTDVSFQIYIDANSDGVYDRVLFNSNPGSMARNLFGNTSVNGQDSFITAVFNIATSGVSTQQFVNRVSSAGLDSALFRNNVMFLAATPASLGLTGSSFRYKVVTGPGFSPLSLALGGFDYDEANGPYTWNYNAQGLNFGGANLLNDLNGATIPVTWNTANMTANGSLGALLLHHFNGAGKRAEIALLDTAQRADLGITKSMSPINPTLGQNVTFTVTVTNNGPNNATGVTVTDLLPAGLTYVSDDGGGAYVSSSGQWTVGALANSASATLHVIATLATTDPVTNMAQVTAATPLDAVPANNQARVTVNAPQSADLSIHVSGPAGPVNPGASVINTITVTNNGDDPAYNIVMTESFPAFPSLHPSSYTASQGTFNTATNVWNIASLGKGATATLTTTVTAPASCSGLTVQGTVTSDVSDPQNANNSDSATTTENDTQPPSITCPANVTKATDPNACTAVVTYPAPMVSDNCSVGTPSCAPPSGSTFQKGVTTVFCSVSDAAMNKATCSFTVTVNDTQPPSITCPANITTKTNTFNDACKVVTFTTPTGSDNCAIQSVVCSPASGSCFAVGTTSVTCTATDTSGNTASCSFTVAVFNVCVQDDSNPGIAFLGNSKTGDYRFCCGGTTFTGKAKVTVLGSIVTFEHNTTDRKVLVRDDEGAFKGTGSLQTPPGVTRCTITDRDTRNNNCVCQ